ncbi:uncharacterized protein LOC144325846 [Podarcis muralis]
MSAGGSSEGSLTLLGVLIGLFFGAVANPNKAPLHQVTGMAGKPVLFPLNITAGKTVLWIKWDLHPRNGTPFELAVLRNGQLRTSNPKDMDRLDVLNETTLRIKALQENETGVLKSRVTYTTSKMEIFEFNLTVFVPAPESDPPDVPSVSQSEGEWRTTLVCFIVAMTAAGFRFMQIVFRRSERVPNNRPPLSFIMGKKRRKKRRSSTDKNCDQVDQNGDSKR